MKPLSAGDLRHRITVRRATEIKTDTGGYRTDWCDYTELWAEVTALDGREVVMDQVLQGISVYRVRIRYRTDLTPDDQLRSAGSCFGGRDVNIRSIADPDGLRKQLIIMVDTASTRS